MPKTRHFDIGRDYITKYATVSQRQRTQILIQNLINLMLNAKVMTFSEISKFSQDFLENFFSKKEEGVFAPYNFAFVLTPWVYPTESAKRMHTAK